MFSVQRGILRPSASFGGILRPPANMGLYYCTELLPNPTWGFRRYLCPPVNVGPLGGKLHRSSGNTTELSILEFFLYTYNVGGEACGLSRR